MIIGPEHDRKCAEEIKRLVSDLNFKLREAAERNITVDLQWNNGRINVTCVKVVRETL